MNENTLSKGFLFLKFLFISLKIKDVYNETTVSENVMKSPTQSSEQFKYANKLEKDKTLKRLNGTVNWNVVLG